MFFVVLILLILLLVALCGIAIVLAVQNFTLLPFSVHLAFLSWHLPGIPVVLLFLFALFLGGLLLYVVSSFAAQRDAQRIKELRARVEELKQELRDMQVKPPSGPLPGSFPLPGFSPSGSLSTRSPFSGSPQNSPLSAGSHVNGSMSPGQFQNAPKSGRLRPPFGR